MMRASIALPRAHATASSAKKIDARCQTRISRSIRVFARRSTHLPLFTRVFSESRVRMRLVLPLSDSTFSFAPIEKLKARTNFPSRSLRALSARERPPLARAVRADRNESTPLQNARSSRRSSFLPGNKRAQKRDKSAPNLLRLLKREGHQEEKKEGKNWCKKRRTKRQKTEKEDRRRNQKRRMELITERNKFALHVLKDLLTTPFFPSFPRVARVSSKRHTSDLLVQRRGAWRSLFCFFLRRTPSFSKRTTSSRENSLLPQKIILFPRVFRGDEKTKTCACALFFRRTNADIFFNCRNISILLLSLFFYTIP